MAPKKAAGSATVYLVVIDSAIDSVHASIETATTRSTEAKDKGKDNVRVEVQQLVGGTINIDPNPAVEEKKVAKATSKAKAIKAENDDDAPAPASAPKANTAAKKTKTPAEQRAVNAAKPTKGEDEDLPDNIKALLKGNGSQLDGLRIVVTGVPPVIGRKNAEKLVQLYGGSLTKSLSKNTSYVVVGNDAGPTKLDKIADLGIETWDEDDLIARIESGGGGVKRSAEDDDDEEEDKKPAASKPKKRKTTKT